MIRKMIVTRKRLLFVYFFSLVAMVLVTLQIVFGIDKSGILHKTPRVNIVPYNCYSETLKVVGDIDFEPYSYVDEYGAYTGHDVEVMYALANRLHKNVEMELLTWSEAVEQVKNGEADVLLGLESISKRNDGLSISSTVVSDAFVVYGKTPIRNVSELQEGRVGTIEGGTEVDIYNIEKDAQLFKTYSQELMALETDVIDFAVIRSSVAKRLISQNGYGDLIQVFDMMDSGLGIGLRSDNRELLRHLNEEIGELQKDGTLGELQKKWLTTYVSGNSFRQVIRQNAVFFSLMFSGTVLCLILIAFLLQKEKQAIQEEYALQQMEFGRLQLAMKEAELTDSRAKIMLSQIQPHFLYNCLGAISQLCRKNPELAATATDTFARYLRTNLKSVEAKEAIPFSEELRHVQAYLWLECLRFGDALRVEYEINWEDFFIPPLTLQPIVENAVKHGLGGKEDGGTIRITSFREGSKSILQVEDDGVGFDPLEIEKDGKLHIGIENVRQRLQMMCQGELLIESQKGVGSKITIRL